MHIAKVLAHGKHHVSGSASRALPLLFPRAQETGTSMKQAPEAASAVPVAGGGGRCGGGRRGGAEE